MLAPCKRGDIDEVERVLKADATLATASTMLGSQPIHLKRELTWAQRYTSD
jgi:hypothetical protein